METDDIIIKQLQQAFEKKLLDEKVNKNKGELKTTFDWSAFELEMPWKFGVYDVSMDFPLDYSLHLREKSFRSGVLKFQEEDIIRFSLGGPSYEDEPKKVCEIMQNAMNKAKFQHQEVYNKYVLRMVDWSKQEYVENKIPSIVSFELGPFVWIVFNQHGAWPAIHRRSDLDDSNYLTYNQKGSDVFVWDNNRGMVRADY